MNLTKRFTGKEQLDNLDLKGKDLHQTLKGLQTINQWFGNVSTVKSALWKAIQQRQLQTITLVDIGCGGGDLLRALAAFLDKKQINYTMIGIDGNPNAIQYAEQASKTYSTLHFQTADILAPDFQLPQCDILISSHFMYHFEDEPLVAFLQRQRRFVRYFILISELQRNPIAYWLFRLFVPLVGFHPMIAQDGATAIRRAFTRAELKNIIQKANFNQFKMEWKWAFRFIISIQVSDTLKDS